MRVWFLKQTPSIDTESSAGANTTVWSREGKIYRITPRQNDAVNDTWMADSGRELFKTVDAPNRVTNATVKNEKAMVEAAFAAASEALSAGALAIVGSSHMSVEEQRLLARLAQAKNATVYIPAHVGKGDGLLVSEDRTPNFRGALVTGLTDRAPVADLKVLAADIDAGKVKSVLIVREDAAMLGLPASALAKVRSVVLATHHNVTTAAAEVVLPALTVFERSGSFINCQFRLQSFAQAVPGPTGVLPDALVLARLAGADAATVWSELSAHVATLTGLDGRLLPAEGVQLDGAAFASHKFPEGKLLKFAPVVLA
jgi:NADH-quinone oxidoreductase subunit G